MEEQGIFSLAKAIYADAANDEAARAAFIAATSDPERHEAVYLHGVDEIIKSARQQHRERAFRVMGEQARVESIVSPAKEYSHEEARKKDRGAKKGSMKAIGDRILAQIYSARLAHTDVMYRDVTWEIAAASYDASLKQEAGDHKNTVIAAGILELMEPARGTKRTLPEFITPEQLKALSDRAEAESQKMLGDGQDEVAA